MSQKTRNGGQEDREALVKALTAAILESIYWERLRAAMDLRDGVEPTTAALQTPRKAWWEYAN